MLKISSFNVNGIRAAERKGFTDWVTHCAPDIICLQEIRAVEDQIPETITALDYHGFYHPARKKGYSGVGILSREEPISVREGMGIDWIDHEGRVIMAEYKEMTVWSVYAPSGTAGDVRQDFKMNFLETFLPFAQKHLKGEKPVVFCGDFNICHTEIDIHNPVRLKNTSGFLPEEREWVSRLIDCGYRDVFRGLNKGISELYSWWSYRAGSKRRNKGWRIDYHMASCDLMEMAREATIEKEWDLSDHAPVTIEYAL